MKKTLLTALLFSSLSHMAFAQGIPERNNENIRFSHITVEDGLSSNNVSAIYQDSQGFLWFGTTTGGLNRFDGIEFKNYTNVQDDKESLPNNYVWRIYQDNTDNMWIATWGGGLSRFDPVREAFINYSYGENNPNGLSSNLVWSVLVDSNGDLWVGTDNGLDKYDPDKKAFIHFYHDPDNPNSLSHNKVSMILEGDDGYLWVGTYGGGLNKFDPETQTFIRYSHNEKAPQSLGNDFIWIIHKDDDGPLWLGTEGGMDKFDPETKIFTHYKHDGNGSQSLSGTPITSIFRDSKERLWIGTRGHGVNLFDPHSETFQRFQHDRNNPQSLADDAVSDIYEDVTGALWFGTFNGVDCFDSNSTRFAHYEHFPGNPTGLSANSVQTFCSDSNGILWIGTRGGGLNRFDPVNQTFKHFLHEPDVPTSLIDNTVLEITQAPDGFLWIGTSAGLDRFDPQKKIFTHSQHNQKNPNSLSHGAVWDIDIDQDGSLWIGMYGGGLDRFEPASQTFTHFMPMQDNPNSLVSEWVFTVLIDSLGMIWVGAEGGLSRLNPETGTFTNFLPDIGDPHSLSDGTINTIYQDEKGTIWIGTNKGLNRFDRETETFTTFGTKEGLAGSMVASVIADNQGHLWIGTNNGLSRFDTKNESFRNYDVRDGLQSNQFRRGALHKSPEGELFLGGVNGFNSFFPESMTDNLYVPPIVLTEFQLFNQSVEIGSELPLQQHISLADQISLSHNQSVISFKFASLNYRNPDKNQYSYMMKGFDKDYIYTSSDNRLATYTNLDPGHYTFHVKGSNNDGMWNEEGTSIEIVISPPWWQTWWFYAAQVVIISIIVMGVMFYVRRLISEITERKRAEKALQESHAKGKRLVDNLVDTILYRHDIEGNFSYVSASITKVLGYSTEEFTTQYSKFLTNHPINQEVVKKTELSINGIQQPPYELQIFHKDGGVHWLEVSEIPVRDDNGKVVAVEGVAHDITKRKQSEDALRKSEEEYQDLYNNAPVMFCSVDVKTAKITQCNNTLLDNTGYTREEIIGSQVFNLYHSDCLEHLKTVVFPTCVETGSVNNTELQLKKKNGCKIDVMLNATSVKDEKGNVILSRSVWRDISDIKKIEVEKKKIEGQFIQAQKMESIGLLAGGVAHDFNNILTSIMGFAELLKLKHPDDSSEEGNAVEIILNGAERATDLTKQLLGFARMGKYNPAALNINNVIQETVKVLEKIFDKNIEAVFDFSKDIHTIEADKNQIDQILTNLIINAKDAMPHGGVLSFKTENVYLDEQFIYTSEDLPPGSYVKISITDTGMGMPPEIVKSIFEPFFTTKGEGKGTGLGLSTVYGIVLNHGGYIDVYSESGVGTTFNLYFPVSEKTIVDIVKKSVIFTGNATILIVDDEKNVREYAETVLQKLGYTVFSAKDGKEAVKIYERKKDEIDLVLLDMIMPNMAGRETNIALKRINPNVRVLLSSGYSKNLAAREILDEGADRFIQKPFRIDELSKIIAELLKQ